MADPVQTDNSVCIAGLRIGEMPARLSMHCLRAAIGARGPDNQRVTDPTVSRDALDGGSYGPLDPSFAMLVQIIMTN